jgi:hypothetical protein
MAQVLVRYKVRPDRVAENEKLVRAVYEELAVTQPGGLRYATFKLDDGVSFAHLAITGDGPNPLAQVAAFRRFQERVAERCEEQPVATTLSEIGSFRLFGKLP